MTYFEAKDFATALIKEHGLDKKGWSVEFNSRRTSLGLCIYRTKKISLSINFLNRSEQKIRNTILHEIAHALTEGQKHSYLWKEVAMGIGCDGRICGDAY